VTRRSYAQRGCQNPTAIGLYVVRYVAGFAISLLCRSVITRIKLALKSVPKLCWHVYNCMSYVQLIGVPPLSLC
jgi:hypothetical protein